ncbi:MAG: ABC transporter permease [Chloroflexi bacterium]|nr:ABC transporter permease [Chloroflexota bacterium]
MQRYIIRRLLFSLVVMWAVMTLVFVMIRAIPGDPITTLAGAEAGVERIEEIKNQMGLNRPVPVQYFYYMRNLLQGDLGDAVFTRAPVTDLIGQALPRTISLSVLAFSIAVVIGVPAGIVSAVRRYSIWDHLATLVAFLGLSMPTFWLAILLIIVFGVWLTWLPVFGYRPITDGLWDWLSHLILPAIATSGIFAAVIARQTRSAMLEVMRQDYVRTAYSKGLTERMVIYRHALRNALIPVITVMGIALALLLTGAVITENVFAINGAGRLLIQSILRRDYPVVQGMVLLVAFIFVLSNLVVDVLYAIINPRIRYT